MKKLIFFGLFLLCVGLAGSSFAQTAAQYIEAGNQTYAAKDYAKAVQYYQAATQMDPNSAAAFQGLGNSQYSLGQNSQALASYEKALTLNPNNAQLSTFVQSLRAKVSAAPASSVVVPSPAAGAAASPASSGGSSSKFELDPVAGIAISTSSGAGMGFGGGLEGYFGGGSDISFGGLASFYTFSGPSVSGYGANLSSSYASIEVMAALKYRLGTGSMRPYLLGGAGISMFSANVSETVTGYGSVSASASTIDPMVTGGGGLEFAAGKDMSFFVEGRAAIIIGSGTFTYLPVGAGLSLSI